MKTVRIVNGFKVRRGGGDEVTLGLCGMCGRKLHLSGANKKGARCRYEGAQYDKNGILLYAAHNKPGRRGEMSARRLLSVGTGTTVAVRTE